MLILQLLFAHFLGDFVFQTNAIFAHKYKSWVGTLEHALIVALCTMFALMPYWGDARAWMILAIILVTHFAQDVLKVEYDKRYNKSHETWPFYMDQMGHIALIMACAWFFPELKQMPMPTWFYGSYFSPVVMSYLNGVVLLTYAYDVLLYQYKVQAGHKKAFQPNYPEMGIRVLTYSIFTLIFLLLVELFLGA